MRQKGEKDILFWAEDGGRGRGALWGRRRGMFLLVGKGAGVNFAQETTCGRMTSDYGAAVEFSALRVAFTFFDKRTQ